MSTLTVQTHNSQERGLGRLAVDALKLCSFQESQNSNNEPKDKSLPSISTLGFDNDPRQYPLPPTHSNMPPQPTSSGLPPPFAGAPRPVPVAENSSPWALHPASFTSQPDINLAFADSPRPPLGLTPGRTDPPHGGPEHRNHRHVFGGYPQPPAPTSHPYQPSHMPFGQMPLPGYPASAGHNYNDTPRLQTQGEPSPFTPVRHDAIPEHYEDWIYQKSFKRIGSRAYTILKFAEVYDRIAQEQRGDAVSECLPTQHEVSELIVNVDYIKESLQRIYKVAHHGERSHARKARDAKRQEVILHNDDMKPHYPVNEVKKRRGRAAPPGRCHSCNRIDTPEWRRGPDGARTLCNACGLHYAKLERKRQLEARSLR